MMVNGLVITVMDSVYRNGLMGLDMKEIGEKIRHLDQESFSMWMVIFLRVSGRTIRRMDMESTCTQMEQNMKVNGKMIYSMDKVLRLGGIIANILESFSRVRNKVEEGMSGQMEVFMKAIGLIIKLQELVNMYGLTDGYTKVSN